MTDRVWDVLPPPGPALAERDRLRIAAEGLGGRRILLAGVEMDGNRLRAVAVSCPVALLTLSVREAFGRPIDVSDLMAFLDDVLRTEPGRSADRVLVIPGGRARRHGLLLHPQDVFGSEPRLYGTRGVLPTDRPVEQRADLPAAADGDPPGPGWAMRYPNPSSEEDRLRALTARTGDPGFENRLRALIEQLRRQGASVWVNSTVRRPERGYLMWGAYRLAQVDDAPEAQETVTLLERARREWGIDVPIDWRGPGDWKERRERARAMAETYAVVFATEKGARSSSHYGGGAVDLVAVDLPSRLELIAPDGEREIFDLSGPTESRDLSLTPRLVDWVEVHFGFRKLRLDYPHWDDVKRPAASAPGVRD
ncbi:hypothetical protein MK280_00125 [Myxococcota bacterium]|nr:hypothetical protein [Myxococcota bacterium]